MEESRLRSLVECPVCLRLPRPPVKVLMCVQSHNICDRCFERLPQKICPQGRCEYMKPPARNRMAEAIMEEAKFPLACRNADDGCDFEAEDATTVDKHEAHCQMGRVACLEGGDCRARLAVGALAEHLRTRHDNVIFLEEAATNNNGGSASSTQKWLLKRKHHIDKPNCQWNTVVWRVDGVDLAIRFVKRNNIWCSWIVAFTGEEAAAKLECKINVTCQGKTYYSHAGKVHPVREEAETIVGEGNCLMLTTDLVASCVSSRGISGESQRAGFDGQLTITYVVGAKGGARSKSRGGGRTKRG